MEGYLLLAVEGGAVEVCPVQPGAEVVGTGGDGHQAGLCSLHGMMRHRSGGR